MKSKINWNRLTDIKYNIIQINRIHHMRQTKSTLLTESHPIKYLINF